MDAREEAHAKQAAQMQHSQEQQMEAMKAQREQQEARENQKKMIIRQLLEPEALERLSRIGLVKKEKQDAIEEAIIRKVQAGALSTKMDDNTLVKMIDELDASSANSRNVKIQRKRQDSDDDLDLDD
ncbi:unnamed protein product [Amoebophrya sp. A120]|nr:unnamed protein product [Amoebophrya sp. A120]|eukprot:GSA120T00006568001.1